jgi:hypothetical protein
VDKGLRYEWLTFENMTQGFIEQLKIRTCAMVFDYNNTILARVDSRIAMYSHYTQITHLQIEYV